MPTAPRKRSIGQVATQAAAEAVASPTSLTGSLTGDQAAPATQEQAEQQLQPDATGMTNEQLAQEEDGAIDTAYTRLNEILASIPGVDYKAKYQEIMKAAEEQPVRKAPGAVQSFAAALGAPDTAPAMLQDAVRMEHNDEQNKYQRILTLKESILQGSIQEELRNGNFRKALVQSEELEKLHATQSRLGRQAKLNDSIEMEKQKQAGREKLQKQRDEAARTRLSAAMAGRADLAKLTGKDRDQYTALAMGLITRLLTQQDITGTPVYTPEQAVDIALTSVPGVVSARGGLTPPKEEKPNGAAPTEAPPQKLSGLAAAAAAARDRRKAAGQTK